jgi:hypothetical protein
MPPKKKAAPKKATKKSPAKKAAPKKPRAPKAPPALGFFGTFKAALYSPQFYASIAQRKGSKAFGYFVLITLLYTAILGGTFWFGTVKDFDANEFVETALDVYPDDLVITIEDGTATVNKDEPFLIEAPAVWTSFFDGLNEHSDPQEISNILVVDTQNEFSISKFQDYQTLMWLTGDSLFFIDDGEGEVSGVSLDEVDDIVLTKDNVSSFKDTALGIVKFFVPMFMAIGFIFIFIGLGIWNLIYLLFLAVFISIVRTALDMDANYGLSYKTGLYAMTFIYVAGVIMDVVRIWTPFATFPFMMSLIALAGVGLNLKNLKS